MLKNSEVKKNNEVNVKQCKKCGLTLDIECFYSQRRICKKCYKLTNNKPNITRIEKSLNKGINSYDIKKDELLIELERTRRDLRLVIKELKDSKENFLKAYKMAIEYKNQCKELKIIKDYKN